MENWRQAALFKDKDLEKLRQQLALLATKPPTKDMVEQVSSLKRRLFEKQFECDLLQRQVAIVSPRPSPGLSRDVADAPVFH